MEIMTANVAMPENKRCRPVQDLLPGILDHIVLDKIVPKLQWKDFYVLSSVGSAWYDAIRSRRVFESRVLSHSSETLVLVYYNNWTIALYSMRENSWHKLPPIINISGGRDPLLMGGCILMDGKIYVLGGVMDYEISKKMFVFDLAGQGHWEQRASMKRRRLLFGSAVIDGKIYVFGGGTPGGHCGSGATHLIGKLTSGSRLISDSEVYDPKEDTWSLISPMTTCQFAQHAVPIGPGEELFMYDGRTNRIGKSRPVSALEAYHPVKDEWRVVQCSWNQPERGELFTAQRNLFSVQLDNTPFFSVLADGTHGNLSLGPLFIYKYDLLGNSWIHVHSFSFAGLIPDGYLRSGMNSKPDAIFAWDDELIALVGCVREGEQTEELCLFQSTGFGGENRKISWKLRAITFHEGLLRLQLAVKYLVHTL